MPFAPWDDDDEMDGVEGEPSLRRQSTVGEYALRYAGRRPLLIGHRTTLCGLEWQAPYWVGHPRVIFRPEGLLFPHAPPGARLAEWRVGLTKSLPLGYSEPIPVSVFLALDDIEARTQKRSRARPSLPACSPGAKFFLRLIDANGADIGPPAELAVWGIFPEHV